MATTYDAQLLRGSLINLAGLVGKLLYPLLFLVITWLCGPSQVGLYMLAVSLAEVAVSAVQAGFTDAVLVFGSRHVDGAESDPAQHAALYRVLAAGFAIPLALSMLIAVAALLGAESFVALVYPDRPALVPALRIVGLTLPFIAFSQACIAGTRAKMLMEYDVLLNAFGRPVLMLVCSALFWKLNPTLASLMWAQLVSYVIVAGLALKAFSRFYSLSALLRAVRARKSDPEVLRFALPQSLNLTLNKYIGRLDVMVLGALGHSNFDLGLFGAAALITTNIREVRLIFSGALGPVIIRHHAQGDREGVERLLNQATRWSTSIAVPILLLVAYLRTDLLRIVDGSYAAADNRFMLVLVITPFLSTAFGLAGNCIVFTGHSRYNLLNSVLVAALNTGFCALLIPRYGLMGAATATALAAFLITILQLVELGKLEHVWLRARAIYKPHLGLAVGIVVLVLLWDPAQLPAAQRLLLALGTVLGYGALMWGLRHEEVVAFVARKRAK
jgi:O-antigen/teichoic acid export membrane protein